MGILLELIGADTVQGNLKRKREYAPRAVKNAGRRIGTLQARAIKSNIKDRTGLLNKSIGSKAKDGRNASVKVLAGARRGFETKITEAAARNKLHGLRQDRKGNLKKVVLKRAGGVKEGDTISPTRYAHLANKKQHFMEKAKAATDPQARQIHADATKEIAQA